MNNLKKYVRLIVEALGQEDMAVFKDWLIDNLYKRGYEDYDDVSYVNYEWKLRKVYSPSLFVLVYTGFSADPPQTFIKREGIGVGIVKNDQLIRYTSFFPIKYDNLSDLMKDFENALDERERMAEEFMGDFSRSKGKKI